MRPVTFLLIGMMMTLPLAGCEDVFPSSARPDTMIRLERGRPGGKLVATPPECPDWHTESNGPLEGVTWPQFGCANTRNLAAMVERPEDLMEGRNEGLANAEMTAGAMGRYMTGKTKALIDPNAKAPAQQVTAGGEGGLGILGGAAGR